MNKRLEGVDYGRALEKLVAGRHVTINDEKVLVHAPDKYQWGIHVYGSVEEVGEAIRQARISLEKSISGKKSNDE